MPTYYHRTILCVHHCNHSSQLLSNLQKTVNEVYYTEASFKVVLSEQFFVVFSN